MSKRQISATKWDRASQHPDAMNVLAYYSVAVDSECGCVYKAKFAIDAFKLNNFLYVLKDGERGVYHARYDVSDGVFRKDYLAFVELGLRTPF